MAIVKKQDNALEEMARAARDFWRHREWDFNIPCAGRKIKDTYQVKKLQLHLNNKLPGLVTGWHLIFTLQPGVSFDDVLKKQHYFSDACRREVSIEKKGGYLHMDIVEEALGNFYPYEWDPQPYLNKMELPVPIGYTAAGLEVVDLASLPHMRVGGTTYTGKSNFLHNLFISLAMLPNTLLAVIDLALLEFSYVKDHAAFAADTPTALALLQALEKEMHRRREVLNNAGVVKIQEYEAEDLPYIVLIIDEYSFVNPSGTHEKEEKELRKECQAICSNIAALAVLCKLGVF